MNLKITSIDKRFFSIEENLDFYEQIIIDYIKKNDFKIILENLQFFFDWCFFVVSCRSLNTNQ